MKKTNLIIIGIILIIGVGVICYLLGSGAGKKSSKATIDYYEKIIDYYTLAPKEVFSISGKITEIQDNVLSIETIAQDPYKLPEEWGKKIIKVTATKETKILQPDSNRVEVVEIKFSDLKINDRVSVNTNENIKDKSEFTANAINLITIE